MSTPPTSNASLNKSPLGTMPPRTADLNEIWAYLETGIDYLVNNDWHSSQESMDSKAHVGMSLYTTVYNACTGMALSCSRS
ncbi:hypothetical protein B0H14DRAFT_1181371 [Mycena olivaceomarginata]|nr:hypothetical protein B0H14DRAFT_1181371 [Mycena olivaceomarginata]